VENKSRNSEADALYSEHDSNDLNASFEKGKGDAEGAESSLENEDNLDYFFTKLDHADRRRTI
jgi:hypothetical protein